MAMVEKSMNRVRAFLRLKGVTKSLLAATAEVHPNSLRNVDSADWNPTAKTLQALDAAAIRLEKAMNQGKANHHGNNGKAGLPSSGA